jgi:hypothetical protein
MLTNKENIVVIEEWTLSDLFDGKFWNEIVGALSSNRSLIESFPPELEVGNKPLNPVIKEKARKDHMIEFMWDLLPKEHRLSFFESDYTVYYIWASSIAIENLIKLHDFLVNQEFTRVSDLISSTGVYQKMVESRNKAFSDMKPGTDTKDIVLMKFYDKLTEEEVISLNTPEYILVSGVDNEKVKGLNEKLLGEKFKLSYTMDYTYGMETIPIYVFHPPKSKK